MHSSSRNAESFPLLRLPGEIREQILLNVVGKQKIHILHVVLVSPERTSKAPDGWRGPYNCSSGLLSGYHHCICRADTSQTADCEWYHRSCSMRQRTWHIDTMGKLHAQRPRWSQVDLSILRVSRRLYAEATHLLWKNTTFAFTDRNSLEAFLQDLNGTQTASLQHLELSTTQIVSTWYASMGANVTNDDSFGLARLGRVSKRLSEVGSLTSLSLHFTYCSSLYMVPKTIMKRQISKGLMSAFGDLSRLDVQHINVTVWERPDSRRVFTVSELEQLASDFHQKLMADSEAYRTTGKDRGTWTGSESGFRNRLKFMNKAKRS